jgi:hypothetical protein
VNSDALTMQDEHDYLQVQLDAAWQRLREVKRQLSVLTAASVGADDSQRASLRRERLRLATEISTLPMDIGELARRVALAHLLFS